MKTRGAVGSLEWAERIGDVTTTNDALNKLGVAENVIRQMEHAVYMFIKNYTAGHAKEVIQHGMLNGVDAWRKLYRDQLPLAEDKRNLIMTEFMRLKAPANAAGLRHLTLEIERITDSWERISNRPFDEEAKIGKLRELIPANVWCYIAQSARNTRTYRELVTLVMNQLTDPKTGMLIGEKTPTLNEVAAQQGLDAIGKGKGKGGKGKCYNCGEEGHHAWACPEKQGKGTDDTAAELFALQYKGSKGKGKRGKGFQGKCFNCHEVGHTAAECKARGKGGKWNGKGKGEGKRGAYSLQPQNDDWNASWDDYTAAWGEENANTPQGTANSVTYNHQWTPMISLTRARPEDGPVENHLGKNGACQPPQNSTTHKHNRLQQRQQPQ